MEQDLNLNAELDQEQLNNLKDILEDDEEMSLSDLVDTFLESAEEQLKSLNTALHDGNRKRFTEAAHSIKGSSSNFGATRMVRISREIQKSSNEPNHEQLDSLVEDLKVEFERVRLALKKI